MGDRCRRGLRRPRTVGREWWARSRAASDRGQPRQPGTANLFADFRGIARNGWTGAALPGAKGVRRELGRGCQGWRSSACQGEGRGNCSEETITRSERSVRSATGIVSVYYAGDGKLGMSTALPPVVRRSLWTSMRWEDGHHIVSSAVALGYRNSTTRQTAPVTVRTLSDIENRKRCCVKPARAPTPCWRTRSHGSPGSHRHHLPAENPKSWVHLRRRNPTAPTQDSNCAPDQRAHALSQVHTEELC